MIVLDEITNDLVSPHARVRLRPQWTKLLKVLGAHHGELVPYQNITARLWGRNQPSNPGFSVSELKNSLLRRAATAGIVIEIETVVAEGLRLVTPIMTAHRIAIDIEIAATLRQLLASHPNTEAAARVSVGMGL